MSEKNVQNYLEKLDELERRLNTAVAPSSEVLSERANIEKYRETLRNFGSYDPHTQEIILEDLDRDITRINISYNFRA